MMRHLKTYRIFESNSEHDDIISVLNDMSLELRDKGFLVFRSSPRSKNNVGVFNHNLINIRVFKANDDADILAGRSKGFYFEEIKETILQMVEFMDSEGWSMKEIEFADNRGWRSLSYLPSEDIQFYANPFIIKFEKR